MTTTSVRAKNQIFGWVFGLAFLAIAAAVWSRLPRFDSPKYFDFADRRSWFGIENASDVLSNLAFIVVGIRGFLRISVLSTEPDSDSLRVAGLLVHKGIYRFIAAASILTAFGSSWFHWNPNIETLFWDRLPMTLGFSGMIALLVADRFSEGAGRKIAVFLSVAAVAHLVLWNSNLSDLRPYIILQYGGVLLAAALLFARWKWGVLSSLGVLSAILFYAAAKVTEATDWKIFEATGSVISGHTIKHLLAAIAIDRLFAAGTPRKKLVPAA